MKSLFATGRASWLLLQPETAATVSSDAIRKLSGKMHQFMRIYTRERKLRDTRFPQSCQIRSSLFLFFPTRFGFEVSRGALQRRKEERITARQTPKWISRRAHEEVEMTRFPPMKLDKLFLGLLGQRSGRERSGETEKRIGLSDNYPKRITRGVLPWPASVHTRVFERTHAS